MTQHSSKASNNKKTNQQPNEQQNQKPKRQQNGSDKGKHKVQGEARTAAQGNKRTPARQEQFSKTKRYNKPYVNKQQAGGRVSSAEDVAAGDRIVVTIKRIGINGEGVGYYKRKAVFIEGALTDEVVKADVTKVERSYMQARLVEIEKRSPHRQEAPCPVYEQCGGCQMQHMTYEAQLTAKEEIVKEAFNRYAGITDLPMRPIIGMEEPWHYRNKAQLQLGMQQDQLVAGLYAQGTHKLIDISECTIQDTTINHVYKSLKHIIKELNLSPYEERTREGVIKTIVVRVARASGKLQVTFVTATDRLPEQRRLIERIRKELPDVISVAHNIHKERSSLIFGPKTTILWGEERLPETLGTIQFALSPRAFFQLNPDQTIKLYDTVKEAAELSGNELVVDAYCGTGTISLWLASEAREVRGIEVIGEAVQDARSNAQYSGIDNALFYEGHAERLLPQWVAQGVKPDVIVVDPPRTGLDAALIQAVLQAKPKRFVYVSCNPSTLAKDCKELLAGGYELQWAQPVDMFPQTAHVECCSLLVYTGDTQL
ncbi:23S rRNA (uracil(1939)-C(5))-methyltransferase RlmD [Paenibacillus septentrionalis]|uniref:23S rRNA (Uracil(1939)-C(5))-methyltransferase RlmD n=1 Tax=Paenibacillus septentrionalis TaxID=429342 RepID=A0ABW1V7A4_9BACL